MISFIMVYRDLLINRPKITNEFFQMMNGILDRNRSCECIVCDYGSKENVRDYLNAFRGVRYVYVEPNKDQWINIPKGLNAGIHAARKSIIAPISTDLRFDDHLIRSVIDFYRIIGSIILRVQCFKLNEENEVHNVTYSPYFFLKSDVIESRGFDERMFGWGKEEDDLIERMFRYQKILEIKIRGMGYIHLWHPEKLREEFDTPNNPNAQLMMENISNNGLNVVNSYW